MGINNKLVNIDYIINNIHLLTFIILLIFLIYLLYTNSLKTTYNKIKHYFLSINLKNLENYSNLKPLQSSDYVSSENLKNNLSSIFKGDYSSYKLYLNGEITDDANIFEENKFLPECCRFHSDYSNSKGCPCITPEQQYHFIRRGGNRHKSSFVHDGDLTNIYFSPTNSFKGNEDEIFNQHSTYITRDSPPLTELSRNVVYSMLYMDDR